MNLQLPIEGIDRYESASQRARVATEGWGQANLYCPNCDSPKLDRSAANTPAIDFTCPRCDAPFQLKSQGQRYSASIPDAAYSAMRRVMEEDKTPNLFALHYEPQLWKVRNLVLIPRFAFSVSILKRRRPLRATARRHGWVGCSFLLDRIPPDAKIPVIVDGVAASPTDIRRQYARLKPLENVSVEKRGWTLDVLNVVRSIRKAEFSLGDVYAFESDLGRLHPHNRHIRDKIRQQLQILRNLNFLTFLGRGDYRLR